MKPETRIFLITVTASVIGSLIVSIVFTLGAGTAIRKLASKVTNKVATEE